MSRTVPPLLLFLLIFLTPFPACSETKVVIAVKSSYNLPGNSLPGIAASIAEGAGLIRLSTSMTADGQVIILDNATLDQITDVHDQFPDRSGTDGFYYPFDFTEEELSQLFLQQQPLPTENDLLEQTSISFLKIPLLSDALSLIRTMTAGTEYRPEVVLEIRQNWRYLKEGKDLSFEALSLMARHGFTEENHGFVATHDPEELKRIHDEIMPALGISLKALQLVDSVNGKETMRFERGKWQPYNYDWLFTKFGLKSLSSYADALGFPPQTALNAEGHPQLAEYFEDAHLLGLKLLAYPFDQYAYPLPVFSETYTDLALFCLFEVGFDGLLTQEDRMLRNALAQRKAEIEQEIKNPRSPIEILLENARKENGHH